MLVALHVCVFCNLNLEAGLCCCHRRRRRRHRCLIEWRAIVFWRCHTEWVVFHFSFDFYYRLMAFSFVCSLICLLVGVGSCNVFFWVSPCCHSAFCAISKNIYRSKVRANYRIHHYLRKVINYWGNCYKHSWPGIKKFEILAYNSAKKT